MNEAVKFIFLMIMGAVVAVLLYWIFFGTVTIGTSDANGNVVGEETAGADASGFYFKSHWDGVLMYSARAIETPISAYYYYYCYLPTVYNNLNLDAELSADTDGAQTITKPDNMVVINTTPSDLEDVNTDIYNVDNGTRFCYNTQFQ